MNDIQPYQFKLEGTSEEEDDSVSKKAESSKKP